MKKIKKYGLIVCIKCLCFLKCVDLLFFSLLVGWSKPDIWGRHVWKLWWTVFCFVTCHRLNNWSVDNIVSCSPGANVVCSPQYLVFWLVKSESDKWITMLKGNRRCALTETSCSFPLGGLSHSACSFGLYDKVVLPSCTSFRLSTKCWRYLCESWWRL